MFYLLEDEDDGEGDDDDQRASRKAEHVAEQNHPDPGVLSIEHFIPPYNHTIMVVKKGSARRHSHASAQSQLIADLDDASQLNELGNGFGDQLQGHAPDSRHTTHDNILTDAAILFYHRDNCSNDDIIHGYLLCLLAVKERTVYTLVQVLMTTSCSHRVADGATRCGPGG